jgi:hypothetical protein
VSADPDTLIARWKDVRRVPFNVPTAVVEAGDALASALEQATAARQEHMIALVEDSQRWQRAYNRVCNEKAAAESDLARAREAIVQARRDLWWFIERATAEDEWGFADTDVTEIAARAMAIQDDVLGAALTAGCGEVSPAEAAGVLDEGTKRTRLDRAAGSGDE